MELEKDNVRVTVACPGRLSLPSLFTFLFFLVLLVANAVYVGYVKTNLSINALTGGGEKYGKMDETTASGYEPEYVAHRILVAAALGEAEVLIAPLNIQIALLLKTLAPGLLQRLLQRKYKK